MQGAQGNIIHAQNPGFQHPQLVLNAVQQPYTPLILTFFHYYHRPTYIRFKDSATDSNRSFPRIDLTLRRRRAMLAQLNEPELGRPDRP